MPYRLAEAWSELTRRLAAIAPPWERTLVLFATWSVIIGGLIALARIVAGTFGEGHNRKKRGPSAGQQILPSALQAPPNGARSQHSSGDGEHRR
jgi:hypothetical protein